MLSWAISLVFEDFISWLTAVMKVSTELGNLSGRQLLLPLNLESFVLFSVDPSHSLSLKLWYNLRYLWRFFFIFVRMRTKIKIFMKSRKLTFWKKISDKLIAFKRIISSKHFLGVVRVSHPYLVEQRCFVRFLVLFCGNCVRIEPCVNFLHDDYDYIVLLCLSYFLFNWLTAS